MIRQGQVRAAGLEDPKNISSMLLVGRKLFVGLLREVMVDEVLVLLELIFILISQTTDLENLF